MGRKKRINKNTLMGGNLPPIENLDSMNYEELQILAQAAPLALRNKIQKSLNSESFDEVMKAQAFLLSQPKNNKVREPEIKSISWNPAEIGFNGKGYRDPNNNISFHTLNRMGEVYVIKAIINTRIEQVQNFLKYSADDQKPGYQIRYKQNPSEIGKGRKDISSKDRATVDYIVKFLEEGGENDKWLCEDNFQEFTRKVLRDSLVLDQMCFEVVRSRNMKLKRYRAVDASLVRQLDTNDPRYAAMFENYRYHGYLPRFAMVWDGQIIRHPITNEYVLFYPWELGYGVRNKTTNVFRNGYGCSELETMMEIVTWILWGMQYNGNFFKQGSQPRGFINVKNSNIDPGTLNEFRQEWKQTMSSVYNAHRVPVIQGIDMEWVDLQHSNRDMEFTEWVKFLFVIACAVYRIDPSELGFHFQDAANIFGQDGQKERLEHSMKKGLTPLLVFYQNVINKYIISEIDDRLEFVFTGIEIDDEDAQVDLDKKKLEAGMVSFEDMFKKYSGRKYNEDKDTILNSIFQTALSNKMMGGDQMNAYADEYGGGDEDLSAYNFDETDLNSEEDKSGEELNPEDFDFNKSVDNPILGKAFDFINKQLSKK